MTTLLPDTRDVDPTRSLKSTLGGIGTVVAPTSAVTALLYYFGWTRTSFAATQLGLDETLLGYSTQDYLLRSLSAMLLPLVIGLLATLMGVGLNTIILDWSGKFDVPGDDATASQRRRTILGRLVAGIAAFGLICLALGFLGSLLSNSTQELYVASPLGVTIGFVLLVYALSLSRRFFAGNRQESPQKLYTPLASSVIVTLIMLSLFWNVSHYAVVRGENLARALEASVQHRPDVIVYSQKRLYIQAPVLESQNPNPEDALYKYAYSGLKLLFRADHKYFLRPSDPSSEVNIVIADGLDIRLDLYKS